MLFSEILCGDPGTPSNGAKVGSDYGFGKTVSFDCNAGYSIRGSIKRTCKSDGNWDGTQPTCKGQFLELSFVPPRMKQKWPNEDNLMCLFNIE